MVTVWWSAAHLIHYSFLNPGELITCDIYAQQIDEDVSKTTTPAASTDQQKESSSSLRQCLTSHCTTNTSKVEWIGLWSFTSSAIFTCALANWLPLLQASQQHFVGKCLYNQQSAENAFQVLIESWSKAFYTLYYRKNKLISHWQKCVDGNGSYFDWERCVWA